VYCLRPSKIYEHDSTRLWSADCAKRFMPRVMSPSCKAVRVIPAIQLALRFLLNSSSFWHLSRRFREDSYLLRASEYFPIGFVRATDSCIDKRFSYHRAQVRERILCIEVRCSEVSTISLMTTPVPNALNHAGGSMLLEDCCYSRSISKQILVP
jgi:hypothetical protein